MESGYQRRQKRKALGLPPKTATEIEGDRRRNRDRKAATRDQIHAVKVRSGCVDCGYNAHPEALQFDHIGTDKRGGVSRMMRDGLGWAAIEQEIAKCEVVCANCHAIRTASRRT